MGGKWTVDENGILILAENDYGLFALNPHSIRMSKVFTKSITGLS